MNKEIEAPISLEDCAKFLGLSESAVYKYTSNDKIPFHKKGKKLYFYKSELNAWIKDE